MTKKTYKIKGMDCPSCATLLEINLTDAGIPCKCSYTKESIEIENEHDIEKVKEIIIESGYNIV